MFSDPDTAARAQSESGGSEEEALFSSSVLRKSSVVWLVFENTLCVWYCQNRIHIG